MLPAIRRNLLVVGACLGPLCTSAPALAQPVSRPPHVRSLSRDVEALVRDAAVRSPSIQLLLARLEQSDVIVYVRMNRFASTALDGRLGLLAAVPGARYLLIELACPRSGIVQMATLGHELHHALEVADEPSVVSAGTLATFYARIGIQTEGDGEGVAFETRAAGEVARRVRREVLGASGPRSTTWSLK